MPRRDPRRKKLDPSKRLTREGRQLTQMYERLWPDTADRMYFFRKASGVSQKALADDCEISAGVISRIECGYGLPQGKTLLKIGKGLALSSDYLLGLSRQKDIAK